MEHIVPKLVIGENISNHFVLHCYMIPSEGVFFFNGANNRTRTALLGQDWLRLNVMNFAQ